MEPMNRLQVHFTDTSFKSSSSSLVVDWSFITPNMLRVRMLGIGQPVPDDAVLIFR
jgi:hypothetical protein